MSCEKKDDLWIFRPELTGKALRISFDELTEILVRSDVFLNGNARVTLREVTGNARGIDTLDLAESANCTGVFFFTITLAATSTLPRRLASFNNNFRLRIFN